MTKPTKPVTLEEAWEACRGCQVSLQMTRRQFFDAGFQSRDAEVERLKEEIQALDSLVHDLDNENRLLNDDLRAALKRIPILSNQATSEWIAAIRERWSL